MSHCDYLKIDGVAGFHVKAARFNIREKGIFSIQILCRFDEASNSDYLEDRTIELHHEGGDFAEIDEDGKIDIKWDARNPKHESSFNCILNGHLDVHEFFGQIKPSDGALFLNASGKVDNVRWDGDSDDMITTFTIENTRIEKNSEWLFGLE